MASCIKHDVIAITITVAAITAVCLLSLLLLLLLLLLMLSLLLSLLLLLLLLLLSFWQWNCCCNLNGRVLESLFYYYCLSVCVRVSVRICTHMQKCIFICHLISVYIINFIGLRLTFNNATLNHPSQFVSTIYINGFVFFLWYAVYNMDVFECR